MLRKTGYVFPCAGGKIVHANDFVALRKKAFAQMRADEAGPARD
jgi:hypothetical protein